ncbi:MAG TPA: nitroreductase family protein [Myxococcota bacterium]
MSDDRTEGESARDDVERAVVDHALSTTRSVRRRIDWARPVAPELIEAAIDVAVQAPTGANAEAWRFLVITDAAPKQAVAELYRRALARYRDTRSEAAQKPSVNELAERLHEVPALILVCSEGVPDAASRALQVAFYASVLPAAWSLMVALRTRGLGATWTTLHLLHEAEAAAALGIPDGVTQTVLLPVGHVRGAVLKPAARKPAREVTYWNRWGDRR